jgi:hypothetical protein
MTWEKLFRMRLLHAPNIRDFKTRLDYSEFDTPPHNPLLRKEGTSRVREWNKNS